MNRKGAISFLGLLVIVHSGYSWSIDKAKVREGRQLPVELDPLIQPQDGIVQEDEPSPYQSWIQEQIELQRRADDELKAAEIAAAAQEEYERIKYDIEHAQQNIYDKVESKRGSATEVVNVDDQENSRQQKEPEMGVPNGVCDDGKSNLETDWDTADPESSKNFTCDAATIHPTQKTFSVTCVPTERPHHVCMRNTVHKQTEPPVKGNHRPLWAKYGKYTFLPWQRWLHNLEHGAIGLLYHKCADQTEVAKFESVLVNCIRKHIITPYDLPEDKPFALVSWGCYLYLSHFDFNTVVSFIRNHALKGRENYLIKDGQYDTMLEEQAQWVSTKDDKDICPKERMAKVMQDLDKASKKRSLSSETANQKQPGLTALKRSPLSDETVAIVDADLVPELEKEALITHVAREAQNENKIAKLADTADSERKADVAILERDLEEVKKLFREIVKPKLQN